MLNPAQLKEALQFVVKAAGEYSYYRPATEHVYAEFNGSEVTFTATDGAHLHTATILCTDMLDPAILRIEDIRKLLAGLTTTGSTVTLETTPDCYTFKQTYKGKERVFECHTFAAKYVDYRAVLKSISYKFDQNTAITFPDGLLEVLASAFKNSDFVKMHFYTQELKVTPSPNPFNMSVTIALESDQELKLAVNPSYLYDAELPTAMYNLSSSEPILVRYAKHPTYIALVMPCNVRS